MSTSKLSHILKRQTNPSILPISPKTFGNNVPKSLHKTRRFWKPNTTRMDWPISVLSTSSGSSSSSLAESSQTAKLRGIKMQMKHVKTIEKAGGLEGVLLSRSGKKLTDFGKTLRAALFDTLHQKRRSMEIGDSKTSLRTITPPSSATRRIGISL